MPPVPIPATRRSVPAPRPFRAAVAVLLSVALLALFGSATAQTCRFEGLWRLASGFGESMSASMDLGDQLVYQGASGTFLLRLVEASRSDDGVTLWGAYDIYDYALDYDIDTGGVAMPMTISMAGARSGFQYTFGNDGSVDVGEIPAMGEGNIRLVATVAGSPIPFDSNEFAFLSSPGLAGTYTCPERDTLMLDLRIDAPGDPSPRYLLEFMRSSE